MLTSTRGFESAGRPARRGPSPSADLGSPTPAPRLREECRRQSPSPRRQTLPTRSRRVPRRRPDDLLDDETRMIRGDLVMVALPGDRQAAPRPHHPSDAFARAGTSWCCPSPAHSSTRPCSARRPADRVERPPQALPGDGRQGHGREARPRRPAHRPPRRRDPARRHPLPRRLPRHRLTASDHTQTVPRSSGTPRRDRTRWRRSRSPRAHRHDPGKYSTAPSPVDRRPRRKARELR